VKSVPAKKAKVRKLARPESEGAGRAAASAARRRRRQIRLVVGAGVAAVVVAGAIWGYSMVGEKQTWQSVPVLASPHIVPGVPHVPYNSNPPTSGPHMGNLANWGVHYQPIPDELQVHNLEDKGVVIQYSCSPECPDLAGKLEAIVKRYKDFVVLAPRPGMDKRIALTAWGKIDTFDEFDEARIVRFIKRFRGIDHHGEG
jgi:hypothetical protein